jgi:hypothetical protein
MNWAIEMVWITADLTERGQLFGRESDWEGMFGTSEEAANWFEWEVFPFYLRFARDFDP